MGEYLQDSSPAIFPRAAKILVVERFYQQKHAFLFQQPRIRFGLFFTLAVQYRWNSVNFLHQPTQTPYTFYFISFPLQTSNLENIFNLVPAYKRQCRQEWPQAIKMKIRVNSRWRVTQSGPSYRLSAKSLRCNGPFSNRPECRTSDSGDLW
jgi:hypothetical protein